MSAYSLTHLADAALLRELAAYVSHDRATTATLLAHLAEVDERRLYLPAGYPSMHAYCVDELRLSEDAALRRIQAARAARQFPVLFGALADGRLHLSAVCVLAPHLTAENAGELLAAATHQRKSAIERLLAQRFPRAEARSPLRAITPLPSNSHALAHVGTDMPDFFGSGGPALAEDSASSPSAAPSERFLVRFEIGSEAHQRLRYAQALLSHTIPSGDVSKVIDRALIALIERLEKRKFGAASKPRPRRRKFAGSHYIPVQVRHAVWERDQGQCTFEGDTGHRCGARRALQFDHIDPVARGGQATVENVRIRCRAHNLLEAERVFGAGFMQEKREAAQCAATEARAAAARDTGELRAAAAQDAAQIRAAGEARAAAEARAAEEAREAAELRAAAEARAMAEARAAADALAVAREQTLDVEAGLRGLGVRAALARQAAEFSETLQGATLEQRLRAALRYLYPKTHVETCTQGSS